MLIQGKDKPKGEYDMQKQRHFTGEEMKKAWMKVIH
jgi:hypothetical protein